MAKKYVIRFKDGKESLPVELEEIKRLIQTGELHRDDDVSPYPNGITLPAGQYTEFGFEPTRSRSFNAPENSFASSENEKTVLFDRNKIATPAGEEKTRLFEERPEVSEIRKLSLADDDQDRDRSADSDIRALQPFEHAPDPKIQQEKTTVFERPKELISKAEPKAKKSKLPKRSFLVMVMLVIVAYDILYEDDDAGKSNPEIVMVPVRPQLPSGGATKADPEQSVKIYNQGNKPYLEDTVQGYRRAADIFQLALRYDPQNVRALAMLASSYLNLIDSSNKDENTFSVINKLIELSRLKDLDLVETLMAEIEFLAAAQRYDAAIQRLVQYSKVSGKFDPVLYYYVGWLYSLKGEYPNAMKYLNQIPATALPMPKLFYLRGFLHEQNQEYDEATAEYKRALALNPKHARSILGLVRVAEKKGELKQMLRYVEFLTNNPSYQSPKEYVSALIYRSKLALLYQQKDEAILSLERAIRIEPKNEDLRLEYYSLLSQSSKDSKYKNLAHMYALVLEGERDMRAGKNHEATTVLLQATDAFNKSEVPLEKMGDLFYQTGEYQKSINNYKRALELNPKAGEIAIKLIDALIKNHEWEDAQKYLSRYRSYPELKSSIDRLAGDLAYYQGNYPQAITFYRKAMARDTIDTEVYSSYANALRELDQCKDAQFFYSLAQRLDPFNYSAIVGAAKCLLKTDSVDAAAGRIQEELGRLPKARADLLTGLGEIYYLARDDQKALQFTAQAKEIDPDYPQSYRIEGLIYLRQMQTKKDAKKKALDALKAYSDRNVSDPFGYLQRFEIFLTDSNFEQAAEELNRVFEVSPRYPELHYRRAQLYARMGRTKDALQELDEELKLNPHLVKALNEQGEIYVRAGNLDEAIKSYVKAMSFDPQNAQAKLGAGYVNYLKRQFTSAIALYQAALALDKGNPEIYKKLGLAYRDSGDGEKASAAFRSYLDLAPDAPDRRQFEQYH
jgi:tetratricopeptide (TPR) repeat protein